MLFLFQTPPSPILVRVVDQEPTTGMRLADVFVRALGVAGALTLASIVFGVVLGAVIFGYRVLQRRREERAGGYQLHISPQP